MLGLILGLESRSLIIACGFFVLYSIIDKYIYRITGFEQCRRPIFISKYVSIIHSIILGTLSCLYFAGVLNLELWGALQCIPIGYCIYDLLLIYGKPVKVEGMVTIHHLLFILFAYFVFPHRTYDVSLAYISEFSNPFLYVSYHMYKTPHKDMYPNAFFGCTVGLLITFTIFRIFNFTYIVWRVITYNYGVLEISGAIIIWVMNLNWYFKLLKRFKENF